MKNATKYLVVGSLGVLMTRRDISSLAVKGLSLTLAKEYSMTLNLRTHVLLLCFLETSNDYAKLNLIGQSELNVQSDVAPYP